MVDPTLSSLFPTFLWCFFLPYSMHSISVNWVSSNVVHRTLSFDVDQSVAPTSFVRGPEICHQSQTHYKVRPAVYFSTLFSILFTLFQHFFSIFSPHFLHIFSNFSDAFSNIFSHISMNWPTGPIQSKSRDVRLFVCLFAPLDAVFFRPLTCPEITWSVPRPLIGQHQSFSIVYLSD